MSEVTEEMIEAAQEAYHDFVAGPDEPPLSHRQKGITRLAFRAALEAALAVQADTDEWEYGIQPVDEPDDHPRDTMPSYEAAQKRAGNTRGDWRVMRRRKAGLWEPVPTPESED